MLVNKDVIYKLYEEGKIRKQEDLREVFNAVFKEIIETIYQAELTETLGYSKYDKAKKKTDNSRNGYSSKRVKSSMGEIELDVPRDRKGEYEPIIVKKRQRDITGIEGKILSLYAKGMSTRDIQEHMKSMYDLDISPETISRITERVLEKAIEWQNRPLNSLYAIIFLDALFYKLRIDGVVKEVAVYAMIGINMEGKKECLGLWIKEKESAKFWLGVLNELKNRGVKDVLIFSVDGLSGLSDAIKTVYPQAEIQRCIVHQVRNSLKFASYKDRRELARDLKKIYSAPSEEMGALELDHLEDKWGDKYPHVIKSWRRNWEEISTLFKYPPEIRRLIYTTNPIESFNSKLRRITKNKGVLPTKDSLFKLLYLAVEDITKKWTGTIRNWSKIYPQLYIYFEERINMATNSNLDI